MSKMLSCLLVDDLERKVQEIREAIQDEVGIENVDIVHVGSANAAAEQLRARAFDLLIIDLNLPLRGGVSPARDGGIRLLRQVVRGTAGIIRPLSIIGVTAFEEIAREAVEEFRLHGWVLVTYAPEGGSWHEAIVNQCLHVTTCKKRILEERVQPDVDVCIITALFDTELEAVLDLPYDWETVAVPGDDTRYSMGVTQGGGRSIDVVACACPEMGNCAAAVTVHKTLQLYRPRLCILAGICAGISAEVGDVAVAEFSLHYDSGKWTEGEGGEAAFLPEPRYRPASSRALESFRRFNVEHQATVAGVSSLWRGDRPERALRVEVGPVASGAAVIENGAIVRNLKFRDRKLVGLEMESYGFYFAAERNAWGSEYLMIKGVCDRATPPKIDKHQKYAAFLSARMIHEFLIVESQIRGGILG
ncbi:MAG: hypothetical protein KJ000_34665 [Pirellulaceae bacterium]|nr:hypothetical protein [Pirellulaceae bacterium]